MRPVRYYSDMQIDLDATALLAEVMRTAAGHGKSSARLDVDAENATGAIGVYERLGFEVARTEVAYGIQI